MGICTVGKVVVGEEVAADGLAGAVSVVVAVLVRRAVVLVEVGRAAWVVGVEAWDVAAAQL